MLCKITISTNDTAHSVLKRLSSISNINVETHEIEQNRVTAFIRAATCADECLSQIICLSLSLIEQEASSVIILKATSTIEPQFTPKGVYIDSNLTTSIKTFFNWESIGYLPGENELIDLLKVTTMRDSYQPSQEIHLSRTNYNRIFQASWLAPHIIHIDFLADSGMGKSTLLQHNTQAINHVFSQLHPNGKNNYDKYWYEQVATFYSLPITSLESFPPELIQHLKTLKEAPVFVIDNLQWIDVFSLTILRRVAKELDGVKIISSSRPTNKNILISEQNHTTIEVLPFTNQECEEFIKLKRPSLRDDIIQVIINESAQHPLILNELINHANSLKQQSQNNTKVVTIHRQLANKIIPDDIGSNPKKKDLYTLLYLLSEINAPVDHQFITDLSIELKSLANLDDLLALPYFLQINVTGLYAFKHDYYRRAVRVAIDFIHTDILKQFAHFLSEQNMLFNASKTYNKAGYPDLSLETLILAADQSHHKKDYLDLFNITKFWSKNEPSYPSDKTSKLKMLWYSGYTQHILGELDQSALAFDQYLILNNIRLSKAHLLYLPLLCCNIRRYPSYSKLKFSKESADKAAFAARKLTNYASFKYSRFTILLNVLRYYLVSQHASYKYEAIGEAEVYLATLLLPLKGHKNSQFWVKAALHKARKGSQEAILKSLVFRVNYEAYTKNWDNPKVLHSLERQITLHRSLKLYEEIVIATSMKMGIHLSKANLTKARTCYNKELKPYAEYSSDWLRIWIHVAELALMVEDSHPSRTLYFYKQIKISTELRATSLIYVASAFMAQDNVNKCYQAIIEVFENSHELKYETHYFDLNISPILEIIIYLDAKNRLNKKTKKRVLKLCKKHCDLIYKSKPFYIGYQGVELFQRDNRRKGLELINKAINIAEERGNTKAIKLFELHKHFALQYSTPIPDPWEGMLARVTTLWKNKTS